MATVLLTGGTGTLGRACATLARNAGHKVRVLSRRPRPPAVAPADWVVGDLRTGEGLAGAIAGVDVVLHAASDPGSARDVDVGGTARLLEAARSHRLRHLIYPSIVGVDRIPWHYYRAKLAAERRIEEGSVPFTIMRATQFHELIAYFLSAAARTPFVLPLPASFRVQSVAAGEVAAALVHAIGERPAGRATDFAGPEVLRLEDMAAEWLAVSGAHRRMVRVRLPGAVARAFREGWNTRPDAVRGRTTWRDWLRHAQRA